MKKGGLLVVPAAPALTHLPHDAEYREALLESDLTIADSAFMVLIWNFLESEKLRRLSGLEYFDALIDDGELRQTGRVFFVMPSTGSAARNISWLRTQGINLQPEQVYVAPRYEREVIDPDLLRIVRARQPRHIVIAIGGGIQEKLGLYLKRNLDYCASIHCIGAAIAFRTRDQVYIPRWADRIGIGWLLRCLWQPRVYVPRYWKARELAVLLHRYRTEIPPFAGQVANRTVRGVDFANRRDPQSEVPGI